MSNTKATIPFHDFGGEGPTLHFAHANGYPAEGYQHFFQHFTPHYRVIASKFRPFWKGSKPQEVKTWRTFADDLIRFLDERQLKGVIGMGHSMGGTISVVAALKRPDLFSKLVLIDPVIFAKNYYYLTNFLPNLLLKRIVPIAKTSSKRRNQWTSKEEVYESWRQKRVFKRFSDDVLQQFINHAIVPAEKGGVTLAHSREWETQIYLTAPYIFDELLKLDIPIIVVRAEKTNVISPDIWNTWQEKQATTTFIDFKGAGHLVPMEFPEALAEQILTLLA